MTAWRSGRWKRGKGEKGGGRRLRTSGKLELRNQSRSFGVGREEGVLNRGWKRVRRLCFFFVSCFCLD